MTKKIEFEGDSGEYEILTLGIELSKDVSGLCLEIGLRLGMGTAIIIDAIAKFCPNKVAVAIDPYGDIFYEGREGRPCRLDYTHSMRNACLAKMYPYSQEKGVRFHYIELTDKDFFDKYADGVILYDMERYVVNKYSFIHFDGPHNIKELQAEVDFFLPRMLPGAIICYDDITPDFFDIKIMEEYMGDRVKLVCFGIKKALYVRTDI